jgi:hypothetical protein
MRLFIPLIPAKAGTQVFSAIRALASFAVILGLVPRIHTRGAIRMEQSGGGASNSSPPGIMDPRHKAWDDGFNKKAWVPAFAGISGD